MIVRATPETGRPGTTVAKRLHPRLRRGSWRRAERIWPLLLVLCSTPESRQCVPAKTTCRTGFDGETPMRRRVGHSRRARIGHLRRPRELPSPLRRRSATASERQRRHRQALVPRRRLNSVCPWRAQSRITTSRPVASASREARSSAARAVSTPCRFSHFCRWRYTGSLGDLSRRQTLRQKTLQTRLFHTPIVARFESCGTRGKWRKPRERRGPTTPRLLPPLRGRSPGRPLP
jgi:hypothetical protein